MEEEQKSKKCFRCNYFRAYYTKSSRNYKRTKNGFCIKRQCIVQNSETCEKWNTKVKHGYATLSIHRALKGILNEYRKYGKYLRKNAKRRIYNSWKNFAASAIVFSPTSENCFAISCKRIRASVRRQTNAKTKATLVNIGVLAAIKT